MKDSIRHRRCGVSHAAPAVGRRYGESNRYVFLWKAAELFRWVRSVSPGFCVWRKYILPGTRTWTQWRNLITTFSDDEKTIWKFWAFWDNNKCVTVGLQEDYVCVAVAVLCGLYTPLKIRDLFASNNCGPQWMCVCVGTSSSPPTGFNEIPKWQIQVFRIFARATRHCVSPMV